MLAIHDLRAHHVLLGLELEILSALGAEEIPHRVVVRVSLYGIPPAVWAIDFGVDPRLGQHPGSLRRAGIVMP